jgi:hypothetical protein
MDGITSLIMMMKPAECRGPYGTRHPRQVTPTLKRGLMNASPLNGACMRMIAAAIVIIHAPTGQYMLTHETHKGMAQK